MTEDQITQLMQDKNIQATIEANKAEAAKQRDAELMILGYNQALLDCGKAALPQDWTTDQLQLVINKQREKLGI